MAEKSSAPVILSMQDQENFKHIAKFHGAIKLDLQQTENVTSSIKYCKD